MASGPLPPSLDVGEIRLIQDSVTETLDRRIIQPVHDQLNQLTLGFLGKEKNEDDPRPLYELRVFDPSVIRNVTIRFVLVLHGLALTWRPRKALS